MAKQSVNSRHYDAENIVVLEGLEPVRKRPGMYIGSTGVDGLHHMLIEIFDNSRDEAMASACDEIEVALLPNGVVRVADNGAGIPVAKHSKTKVSALETVMTTLHAGGKFDDSGYKIAGGLHGVGASVVNALSEWLVARVHRDGAEHRQEYKRGVKKSPVKKIASSKKHGTIVKFKPDTEIFSETEYNLDKIVTRMREQAYLVKGLRIRVVDARDYSEEIEDEKVFFLHELFLQVPTQTFYFEGGLYSLIKFYNVYEKPVHKNIFYVEKEVNGIQIEIALQYIDDIIGREITFANNTATPEGGMHLTGFRTALTRVINDYAKKNNLVKDETFTGDDVREGLTAVISVKLRNAQFEGQTKAKLGNPDARSAVEQMFGEEFAAFLEEHPDDAKQIIGKATLALKARKAAKAAKDSVLRKGALEGLTLPGKLADCQTRKQDEAELFIVEGDSAGGTAKQGRDRRTQAILPLRGKILNVERARIDKMLANKEVKSLVIGLGTAIGDTFNIEKLRYGKIIIATDADVDGSHIRTLLLTLFYRYFRPLVDAGHIFIAQPPLYKIGTGKNAQYVFTEDEMRKIVGVEDISEIEEEGVVDAEVVQEEESEEDEEGESKSKKKKKLAIQRYKGLGEMNASELWETTMNPETRVLKLVTVDDAKEADKTFDILMGNEVEPRKLFIQSNAKLANLDI